MSEPENFLRRWSRRKQEDAKHEAKAEIPAHEPEKSVPANQGTTEPSPESAVDLSKLPSLEEIAAETDITAFLKPGVPADLARAALRRAWASDPAVRDFVGLQENDWVFNKPGPEQGFGPLGPEHDVGKLLAQVFGEPAAADSAAESKAAEEKPSQAPARLSVEIASVTSAQVDAPKIVQRKGNDATHNGEQENGSRHSSHGGALPRPVSET